MADVPLRVTVPTNFNTLDNGNYRDAASTHALLGRELARNDRWLDQHLRRGWSEAYPQNQVDLGAALCQYPEPQIWSPSGQRLGPKTHVGTPGVKRGEWYVRAEIPLAGEVVAVPFVSSPPLLPVRVPDDLALAGEYLCVGTGAKKNYGPIPSPITEGACRVGLTFWAKYDSGTGTTGTVANCHLFWLTSTAGSFAALSPPFPSIRIYQVIGGITMYLSSWCQIVGVWTRAIVGDSVWLASPICDPPIPPLPSGVAVSWEMRSVTGLMTIYADMFRETE